MDTLKVTNVDFKELMAVIDKCSGPVWLITEEGDRLNLKSKLCQLIGIMSMIENGQVKAANIVCDLIEDQSRLFRFMIYREV